MLEVHGDLTIILITIALEVHLHLLLTEVQVISQEGLVQVEVLVEEVEERIKEPFQSLS